MGDAAPIVTRATLPRYENDTAALRYAFSLFPSGVVALISRTEGELEGMVASAFAVGVSLTPPLVSCAIQTKSRTWPRLRRAASIGISVLAEGQGEIAREIAGENRLRRFASAPLRDVGSDAVFVSGAPVWFECTVHAELEAGDHIVVLFEVIGVGADPDLRPLVFHASSFNQLLARPDLGQV
jgi:flavin reductase (DIM6/NTAB) family NADH-FMN oxidoreductase RutF